MLHPSRLRLLFLPFAAGLAAAVTPAGAWEYLGRFPEDKVKVTAVATDQAGNAFVCGNVDNAASLPGSIRIGGTNTGNASADAFVMKFAPDGTRVAVTVFGGGASEVAQGVAVDGAGNVIVLGATESTDFPLVNGLGRSREGNGGDIFIAKFDGSLTHLFFSTLIGGSQEETPVALGVDGQGEI